MITWSVFLCPCRVLAHHSLLSRSHGRAATTAIAVIRIASPERFQCPFRRPKSKQLPPAAPMRSAFSRFRSMANPSSGACRAGLRGGASTPTCLPQGARQGHMSSTGRAPLDERGAERRAAAVASHLPPAPRACQDLADADRGKGALPLGVASATGRAGVARGHVARLSSSLARSQWQSAPQGTRCLARRC